MAAGVLHVFILVLLSDRLLAEYKWINNEWVWVEADAVNEGSGAGSSVGGGGGGLESDDEDPFDFFKGNSNGVVDVDADDGDELTRFNGGGQQQSSHDLGGSRLQPFGATTDDEDFALDGGSGDGGDTDDGWLDPDDPFEREGSGGNGGFDNSRQYPPSVHRPQPTDDASNSYPKPIDVDSSYDPSADITAFGGGGGGGGDHEDDDEYYDYSDESYDDILTDRDDDEGISIDDNGFGGDSGFNPGGYHPYTTTTARPLGSSSTTVSPFFNTRRTTTTTTSTSTTTVSTVQARQPGGGGGGGGGRQESHTPNVIDMPTNRPVSFFAQPGILAAVIGGAVVGLLCAILLVMFIVYRMRKKDEGSYILDEPKRVQHSKRAKGEIYA